MNAASVRLALAAITSFTSLCGFAVCAARAGDLTTLHAFSSGTSFSYEPFGELAVVGSTIYGATGGDDFNGGTIFSIGIDGSSFQVLHAFPFSASTTTGTHPQAGVVTDGSRLFGTTLHGGSAFDGTLYSINLDGSNYQTLHNFNDNSSLPNGFGDGSAPRSAVTLWGSKIVGTTGNGGSSNDWGLAYQVNLDGSNYTGLYPFPGSPLSGTTPAGKLTSYDGKLYGTTEGGGTFDKGTIYAITGFNNMQILHSFGGTGDGTAPGDSVSVIGDTIYGITTGASPTQGSLFAMDLDGSNYRLLHTFDGATDGRLPNSALVQIGTTLYGTTVQDAVNSFGTVFAINPDGTGYHIVHRFSNTDGRNPRGLTVIDDRLYGVTAFGGPNGQGTLFMLVPEPGSLALSIVGFAALTCIAWRRLQRR